MAKGGGSKKQGRKRKHGKGNARANKWNDRAQELWGRMLNRGNKFVRSERVKV